MADTWQDSSGAFSRAILNPDLDVPAGIHGPVLGKADRRYAVHRNNVTVSLIAALEANFPSVRRLAGKEFFAAMARQFVRAHPPKSRLLAEYGGEFAGFIAGFEPLVEYPFMADVARLERLWLDSYHEADAPVLAGAELAGIAPETLFGLRFNPHPAMRLFCSPFAAVTIMSANRSSGKVPQIDVTEPEFGLITRPALQVDVRTITASSHVFLTELASQAPLAEAVEAAQDSDAGFDLAANLQGMLSAGAFTSFVPDSQI
jgi:Putative DNA-binding domain